MTASPPASPASPASPGGPADAAVVLTAAAVVTPDAVHAPGWLELRGDRITRVEAGAPPVDRTVDLDLSDRTVVPGFVDTHVHGGGGASYLSGDPDEAAAVAAFHLGHGTTTTYASLVTAELDDLDRQVRALADLVDDGVVAGLHLEGPWLSEARCGAHDPRLLRAPETSQVRRLLEAGRGTVAMVTLAPELPGGLAAVAEVREAGAVAAAGHTDASYDTTREAVDAGAAVATHLFNGMPPVHHRSPGPVVALTGDDRVTVELVADGVHLHAATIGLAVRAAGVDRVALVTDAMTAAGAADGDYLLGGQRVRVVDGVARLADGGSIAGSTLTMDAAFRFAVSEVGLGLVEAARIAATTPARAHGLDEVGALRPGARADLVVLDADLAVVGVMRRGGWIRQP